MRFWPVHIVMTKSDLSHVWAKKIWFGPAAWTFNNIYDNEWFFHRFPLRLDEGEILFSEEVFPQSRAESNYSFGCHDLFMKPSLYKPDVNSELAIYLLLSHKNVLPGQFPSRAFLREEYDMPEQILLALACTLIDLVLYASYWTRTQKEALIQLKPCIYNIVRQQEVIVV